MSVNTYHGTTQRLAIHFHTKHEALTFTLQFSSRLRILCLMLSVYRPDRQRVGWVPFRICSQTSTQNYKANTAVTATVVETYSFWMIIFLVSGDCQSSPGVAIIPSIQLVYTISAKNALHHCFGGYSTKRCILIRLHNQNFTDIH